MADITNVKIGVCSVSFGGTDLGHTQGGCTVSYSPEWADMTVDQWGNTIFDKALLGQELTVTVPLAESQLANMKIALPTAEYGVIDGTRLEIGSDAGQRLSAYAAKLVLHPIRMAVGDKTEDVVLYKAAAHESVEIAYSNEEQTVIEITFLALIDTTKTSGNLLGHFGDEDAVDPV